MRDTIALATDDDVRSASRTNICLVAALIVGGTSQSVRIRNLSPSGALVDGAALPPAGVEVQLSRGLQMAAGKIVWSENKRCGIHFADRLMVGDWLPKGIGNQNQIRTDKTVVQSGQGPTPAVAHPPRQLRHIDAAILDRRLADEIAYAARQLECLSRDIAKEPMLVARHSREMRNLDLVRDILGRVATVLRAEDMGEAERNSGMESLQASPPRA